MGYSIEECSGDPGQVAEAASFLAAFVADGEGAKRDIEGRKPEIWESRIGWWWKSNPFCQPDSPRGLMLRSDRGEMVGFFGFIPHDYILGGEKVPSLISTTTFVRQNAREAALGLFLRAHRLREKYHMVDGGPNKEAQAILKKTGYRHADSSKVFLFPVKRRSMRPASWMMQAARIVTPKGNGLPRAYHLVSGIKDVAGVPPIRDHRLRKQITRETLAWYIDSGSRKKHFVGWCDEDGILQGYLLGVLRRRFGLTVLVILDAATFDPLSENTLSELVAHISQSPDQAGIPGDVDLIAWPTQHRHSKRVSFLALKHDPKIFYRLPSQLGDPERLCVPFEGDAALL